MTTSLTRIERLLADADFGSAVIAGFRQDTREDKSRVSIARKTQAATRVLLGYREAPAAVLTPGASQHKLAKNSATSLGLMLTPERGMMAASVADIRTALRITGPVNLCPRASGGCALACLSTSGQSGMPAQQRAQSARTGFLLSHPVETGLIIGAELRAAIRRNGVVNLRLNTTSDIRWELVAPEMIQTLTAAGVRLYDYTAWSPADRSPSANYSLTYSAKETTHTSDEYLLGILRSGGTVAMPFDTPRGKPLPETWHGYRVIDGDESDERYLDPPSVIVGLRAKGHRWKRDNSAGFIRSAAVAL